MPNFFWVGAGNEPDLLFCSQCDRTANCSSCKLRGEACVWINATPTYVVCPALLVSVTALTLSLFPSLKSLC
jgi:hypothetical protein